MAFLGELLTYTFKYIILLAVTVVAIICGAKYKKHKIEKNIANAESVDTQNIETEN